MRAFWIVMIAIGALIAVMVATELPSLHRYQKISRM